MEALFDVALAAVGSGPPCQEIEIADVATNAGGPGVPGNPMHWKEPGFHSHVLSMRQYTS